MKILHVIASVDPRGGGPIAGVIASAEVWARHGHERHIVSLDVPDDHWEQQSPVKTFAMGLGGNLYRALRKKLAWLRYGYADKHFCECAARLAVPFWNILEWRRRASKSAAQDQF